MVNDLSAFAGILIKAWRNDKLREVGAALTVAERAAECERRLSRARKPAPRYVQIHIDHRTWEVLQQQPVIIGVDERGNRWELRRQIE
ncbi:MAG: hypothetical protein IT323_13425 [Anaerolineae bacterium]|nr:hypothetical protein [Anaerolineae bacterium]